MKTPMSLENYELVPDNINTLIYSQNLIFIQFKMPVAFELLLAAWCQKK